MTALDQLPYEILRPTGNPLPVVLSSPHSGTDIPDHIRATMRASGVTADTDWFVDQLYGFAPALGFTLIKARYSRFVIDLNRDPEGRALYVDGRKETSLVPTKTFSAEEIYAGAIPDEQEIARRRALYFDPYYDAIRDLLRDLRASHKHVLFFDCHSIRRLVPTIRPTAFPDLILGDQDGRTADPRLSQKAIHHLFNGQHSALARPLSVAHNEPFKGGYLTRHFGTPSTGIHALQLEMCQDLYMDADTVLRDPRKEDSMKAILKETLQALAVTLSQLQ